MTFVRSSIERTCSLEELAAERNASAIVTDGQTFAIQNGRLAGVEVSSAGAFLACLGRRDGAPLLLVQGTPPPGAVDFRVAAGSISASEMEVLTLAKALLEWDARTRFCGSCGSSVRAMRAGFARLCTNTECGREIFPRVDPAVIMIVTCGERALLARHHAYATRWSTLAGFVEPGETLEAAVARELLEETGISASTIRYAGSQPWPLPASVMIGFEVEAANEALTIDPEELAEARWFTREEIVSQRIPLSSSISISRVLIDGWLQRP